jgi:hypothetical protein
MTTSGPSTSPDEMNIASPTANDMLPFVLTETSSTLSSFTDERYWCYFPFRTFLRSSFLKRFKSDDIQKLSERKVTPIPLIRKTG